MTRRMAARTRVVEGWGMGYMEEEGEVYKSDGYEIRQEECNGRKVINDVKRDRDECE